MKIIHVDDHPLFSESLDTLLKSYDSAINLLSVPNGQQALGLLDSEEEVDLILMDLDMPVINGAMMLEAIKNRDISAPVLIVSGSEDFWDIRNVMNAGAAGFVSKTAKPKVFLEAMEQVLEGRESYLSDDTRAAISRLPKHKPQDKIDQLLVEYDISMKQYEVLKIMGKGYDRSDIAKMLHLSVNTIKTHTSALYTALNVKSGLECVIRAQTIGLLPK